jgi:hypothetical protein
MVTLTYDGEIDLAQFQLGTDEGDRFRADPGVAPTATVCAREVDMSRTWFGPMGWLCARWQEIAALLERLWVRRRRCRDGNMPRLCGTPRVAVYFLENVTFTHGIRSCLAFAPHGHALLSGVGQG